MLRILNLQVPLQEETPLLELAAKRLQIPPQEILEVVVVRKAVDARRRKGAPIYFVYVLDVKVRCNEERIASKFRRDPNIQKEKPVEKKQISFGSSGLKNRPVVVGLGPAGLMAALILAENGYQPLVLERGKDVDHRLLDIQHFWQSGNLDKDSNVQFGEGGAGTFSDGKLTTRINDSKMQDVLRWFVAAGAPAEIQYLHKPHVGTDRLRMMVKNLRKKIIALGGEVLFETKVTDVIVKNGRLTGLEVNGGNSIPCEAVLFAIGHSARDTYVLLHKRGIAMEAKAFAIGVRIEHPQEIIDRAQYGADAGHPRLGAADYALTYQNRETGGSAYSFCMCPGGEVVAAASCLDGVVTNGMSNYKRDSGIANSALLVPVTPADFPSDDVLAGIAFQEACERAAFIAGGGDYFAPVQTVGDFLAGKWGSRSFLTKPTYQPGVRPAKLTDFLPGFVCRSLAEALPVWGSKIKGFDHAEALMTGIESRSSAPVRILRDRESYVSLSVDGIYPVGEGAGYAGGIMSAAVDGLHAAEALMKKYSNFTDRK